MEYLSCLCGRKGWPLYPDPSDQQHSDISESSATCHFIPLLFPQIISNLSLSICWSPPMHRVILFIYYFHSAVQIAITLRYIGCHTHSARHRCPSTHLPAIRYLQGRCCTCRSQDLTPREIFMEHIYLYMFFPTSISCSDTFPTLPPLPSSSKIQNYGSCFDPFCGLPLHRRDRVGS